MITQETIDKHNELCEESKKKFGPGPWNKEPNRHEWKYKGMQCLALRQPTSGHWCGYVGLKPGHKYYGIPDSLPWDEKNKSRVDAFSLPFGHGGVTYGQFCNGFVCHINDNEDESPLFWLGFDCAHSGDYTPMSASYREGWREYETYKNFDFIKRETEKMVEELLEDQ